MNAQNIRVNEEGQLLAKYDQVSIEYEGQVNPSLNRMSEAFLVVAKLGSWHKLGFVDKHEHEVEHGNIDEDGLTGLEEPQLSSQKC